MREVWDPRDWRARAPSWRPRPYEPPRRRRSFLVPRLRRLVILIAIWLGLLIWPAPQIGDFLSAQGTHLANTTTTSVSHLVVRGIGSIPGPLGSAGDSSQQHTFWQVGLAADGTPANDTGIRTTIETVVPQQVSQQTTNYYWVGAYLGDGSFIQAGYYVPWYDTAHAGWFYCAFTTSGHEGPCKYGPLGSVGNNTTRHTYAMESAPQKSGVVWRMLVDNTVIGQFPWTSGDTGASAPVIYAESSGFAAHDPTSRLGPVDFSGLDVRPTGASAYTPSLHLLVVYNALNVCPPYGIAADGHGGVLLGSGLACPDRWTLLW